MGFWGWFVVGFLATWVIAGLVWMVVAVHNAPTEEELLSGEWRKNR